MVSAAKVPDEPGPRRLPIVGLIEASLRASDLGVHGAPPGDEGFFIVVALWVPHHSATHSAPTVGLVPRPVLDLALRRAIANGKTSSTFFVLMAQVSLGYA